MVDGSWSFQLFFFFFFFTFTPPLPASVSSSSLDSRNLFLCPSPASESSEYCTDLPTLRHRNICTSCKAHKTKDHTEKTKKIVRFHSLSRPAVQFGRCGQVFPLPGSPSAPSGETPPLILLLLPLTNTCIKKLKVCACLGWRCGNIIMQVCFSVY